MSSKSRQVFITGCASGFGRMLTSAFLARGWKVYATLRKLDERRESFVEEQGKWGEQLQLREFDVTNESQRQSLVEEFTETGLDCLINNAGFGQFGAAETLSDEQFRQQFEVNVFACLFLTRDLLPALRSKKGSIVFLSSVLGYSGVPLTSAYCSSKFALEGFAEALYHELAPFDTRVYLIEPGGHRTDFGTNTSWGQLESPAFAQHTNNYKSFLAKKLSAPGTPPQGVIDKIVKLVHSRSKRLRVPLGSDAKQLYFLKHLVPEWLHHRLLHSVFRGMFWREAAQ
ncbi:MAG: SDR family oxidoreductase [Planctomycetota bacterium]|nr:SDR family oxidoreductase [Planctomycetota bacterium]